MALFAILIVALVAVGLWQLQRYWVRWFRGVAFACIAAFRRGDYEGQLREAERLKNWIPSAHLLFRGMALYELGRFKEAEESLRQSLPMRKDSQKRATCEAVLGMVLREQQRFEEAMSCFESALRVKAQSGDVNREVAKTLLRQGTQPGEALRQARKAVEIDQVHRSATLSGVAQRLDAEVRERFSSRAMIWRRRRRAEALHVLPRQARGQGGEFALHDGAQRLGVGERAHVQ